MEGRIESAGGDEFCFRETEGETNSPTGRAAGRGSRSAETAIVKVRKSGQESQRMPLGRVTILEQLFTKVKGCGRQASEVSRLPAGWIWRIVIAG